MLLKTKIQKWFLIIKYVFLFLYLKNKKLLLKTVVKRTFTFIHNSS